jgi:hypothetical protein
VKLSFTFSGPDPDGSDIRLPIIDTLDGPEERDGILLVSEPTYGKYEGSRTNAQDLASDLARHRLEIPRVDRGIYQTDGTLRRERKVDDLSAFAIRYSNKPVCGL